MSQNIRGSGGFRSVAAFALVFALFAVSCSANLQDSGSEEVVENILVFDDVFTVLFEEIMPFLDSEHPVYLISTSDGSVSQRYLDTRFHSYLSDKVPETFQAGPSFLNGLPKENSKGQAVQLEVRDMKTGYSEPENNEKSKKLSRLIEVQVFCKVIDCQNGRVVLAETFSESRKDFIDSGDIGRIERQEFPFTVALYERNKSLLKEFLEVGTVLSAAGIIIYLFFSTRS